MRNLFSLAVSDYCSDITSLASEICALFKKASIRNSMSSN